MDVVSHGLWGGLAFGQKNKKLFIFAFLFGVIPDIFAFAWPFLKVLFGGEFQHYPSSDAMPAYILSMYSVTHSLVIALVVFIIAFLIWKKSSFPILAWPLHILFDIPTHDLNYFPTPYLWPFNTPFFDGIGWSNPWIFFTNWILLIGLMGLLYFKKRTK